MFSSVLRVRGLCQLRAGVPNHTRTIRHLYHSTRSTRTSRSNLFTSRFHGGNVGSRSTTVQNLLYQSGQSVCPLVSRASFASSSSAGPLPVHVEEKSEEEIEEELKEAQEGVPEKTEQELIQEMEQTAATFPSEWFQGDYHARMRWVVQEYVSKYIRVGATTGREAPQSTDAALLSESRPADIPIPSVPLLTEMIKQHLFHRISPDTADLLDAACREGVLYAWNASEVADFAESLVKCEQYQRTLHYIAYQHRIKVPSQHHEKSLSPHMRAYKHEMDDVRVKANILRESKKHQAQLKRMSNDPNWAGSKNGIQDILDIEGKVDMNKVREHGYMSNSVFDEVQDIPKAPTSSSTPTTSSSSSSSNSDNMKEKEMSSILGGAEDMSMADMGLGMEEGDKDANLWTGDSSSDSDATSVYGAHIPKGFKPTRKQISRYFDEVPLTDICDRGAAKVRFTLIRPQTALLLLHRLIQDGQDELASFVLPLCRFQTRTLMGYLPDKRSFAYTLDALALNGDFYRSYSMYHWIVSNPEARVEMSKYVAAKPFLRLLVSQLRRDVAVQVSTILSEPTMTTVAHIHEKLRKQLSEPTPDSGMMISYLEELENIIDETHVSSSRSSGLQTMEPEQSISDVEMHIEPVVCQAVAQCIGQRVAQRKSPFTHDSGFIGEVNDLFDEVSVLQHLPVKMKELLNRCVQARDAKKLAADGALRSHIWSMVGVASNRDTSEKSLFVLGKLNRLVVLDMLCRIVSRPGAESNQLRAMVVPMLLRSMRSASKRALLTSEQSNNSVVRMGCVDVSTGLANHLKAHRSHAIEFHFALATLFDSIVRVVMSMSSTMASTVEGLQNATSLMMDQTIEGDTAKDIHASYMFVDTAADYLLACKMYLITLRHNSSKKEAVAQHIQGTDLEEISDFREAIMEMQRCQHMLSLDQIHMDNEYSMPSNGKAPPRNSMGVAEAQGYNGAFLMNLDGVLPSRVCLSRPQMQRLRDIAEIMNGLLKDVASA